MVKSRVRFNKKGKRWPKGQSSNSNPECKQYRNLAQNIYFRPEDEGKEPTLTIAALKEHDDLLSDGYQKKINENESINNSERMEIESSSNATALTNTTFASEFSACTNVSFSRFLNHFNSQSAQQKEMLGVLTGITEIIKSNGGTESAVEYFAALMTTLEQMNTDKDRNTDTVAAVFSLLAMCIKSVSRPVLQTKCSNIFKILSIYWESYADSNHSGILKSILKCVGTVLMAQEVAVWQESSTVLLYNRILLFTTHEKPKIRKSAQLAVRSILKSSWLFRDDPNILFHPVAKHTGNYCIEVLENCILNGEVTRTLHMLTLLQEILMTFHESHLKTCCESILKLMTLNDILLTTCGLRTLHNMLNSRPDVKRFPVELNVNLITALYDYQPDSVNSRITSGWLVAMQEAFVNLSKNDLLACMAVLPKFVDSCIEALKSEIKDVVNNSSVVLKNLIIDCIASAGTKENIDKYFPYIKEIFNKLYTCLQSTYSVSHQLLFILKLFVTYSGETCYDFMIPCFKTLAEFRNEKKFLPANELDHFFLAVVKVVDPEVIMQEKLIEVVLSNNNYVIKNSWLLPIMKGNIKRSTLQCFNKYFLPLAINCWEKFNACKKSDNKNASMYYDLLQCQIWALLPSFCEHATDVVDTFPLMAKGLGITLKTRKDLTIIILSSLRKLIKRCGEDEAIFRIIAGYSKNFLPILFNIYVAPSEVGQDDSIRSSAFRTIEGYLKITEENMRVDLYNKALAKLNATDTDSSSQSVKESIFDLLKILVPYQDSDTIRNLYDCYISKVLDQEGKEQKKVFRLLQAIIGCSEEGGCKQFVKDNMSEVSHLLLQSLHSSPIITRGARVQCLISLLDYGIPRSALMEIIPEAVLCCKDINKQCRKNAVSFLIKLYDTVRDMGEDESTEFFNYVMAGLVGSVTMISATLIALTSLIYFKKDKVNRDQFNVILEGVCLLCASVTRAIVGNALSFIKTAISAFPDSISYNLPMIVKSLCSMTDQCKSGLRRRLKIIFLHLVRKYGMSTIVNFVPTEDKKTLLRLKSIRKTENRSVRKLAERAVLREEKKKNSNNQVSKLLLKSGPVVESADDILAECDDDDDYFTDDEEDEIAVKARQKKTNKKNKNGTDAAISIRETADSIVDFTDGNVNKNIIVKNKQDKKKLNSAEITAGSMDGGFKVAEDGRLIITEEDDEDVSRATKKRNRTNKGGEFQREKVDSLSHNFTDLSIKKRKVRNSESEDSDGDRRGPLKYKPGGSGIHRRTGGRKVMKNVDGHTGHEYQSLKATGDIKKKGLPDPFAYVPLKRNMLNKRKRKKALAQFKVDVKRNPKQRQDKSKKSYKN